MIHSRGLLYSPISIYIYKYVLWPRHRTCTSMRRQASARKTRVGRLLPNRYRQACHLPSIVTLPFRELSQFQPPPSPPSISIGIWSKLWISDALPDANQVYGLRKRRQELETSSVIVEIPPPSMYFPSIDQLNGEVLYLHKEVWQSLFKIMMNHLLRGLYTYSLSKSNGHSRGVNCLVYQNRIFMWPFKRGIKMEFIMRLFTDVCFQVKINLIPPDPEVCHDLPLPHHRGRLLPPTKSIKRHFPPDENLAYWPYQVWTNRKCKEELIVDREKRRERFGWRVDLDDYKRPYWQNIADKVKAYEAIEAAKVNRPILKKKPAKAKKLKPPPDPLPDEEDFQLLLEHVPE